MSALWPQTLTDKLIQLAEQQEYEKLWTAILILNFPPVEGFSIRLIQNGGPKKSTNRTISSASQACALVVSCRSEVHLILTCEIVLDTRHLLERSPHPDVRSLWDVLPRFHNETVRHLHAIGTTLSYITFSVDPWGTITFEDPQNLQFDFFEEQGQKSLMRWCKLVEDDIFEPPPQLHVEDSTAYLESKEGLSVGKLGHTLMAMFRSLVPLKPTAITNRSLTGSEMSSSTISRLPFDVFSEIASYLPSHDIRMCSLVDHLFNDLVAPRLWRGMSMHRDTLFRKSSTLEIMFSALVRNAPHIRRLSILSVWVWTDERLASFKEALKRFQSLATLNILLPRRPGFRTITHVGGEYSALFRLLAKEGTHLQLQSLQVEHVARPTSPLLGFLASQKSLARLHGLELTPQREFVIQRGFLPKLETLSTGSLPLAMGLIPGRPIVDLTLEGGATHVNFLNALERSSGSRLRLSVERRAANVGSQRDDEEIVRRLGSMKFKVHDLSLDFCEIRPTSQLGFDKLDGLVYLCVNRFHGSNEAMGIWLQSQCPPSLKKFMILRGHQFGTRKLDGSWNIDPEIDDEILALIPP